MAEPRPLPDHVTTPLLTRITEASLDEDYRVVAERKAADPGSGGPPASRPQWVAATVVVAFGLLVTTAAVQTSRNADVDNASRAALVAQVESGRAALAARQEQIARLQDENLALERSLSGLNGDALREIGALREVQAGTGYVGVTGPGVRISVDDPPGGDLTQLVRSDDLALLVDGLWRAGAEAISINGQRLTALGSLSNRGPAVQVNSHPVNPPYVVQAIGDPRTLPADLVDTTHGSEFFDLAESLGFVYSVSVENDDDGLTLPAARPPRLRHVKVGTAGDNPGVGEDEEVNP